MCFGVVFDPPETPNNDLSHAETSSNEMIISNSTSTIDFSEKAPVYPKFLTPAFPTPKSTAAILRLIAKRQQRIQP